MKIEEYLILSILILFTNFGFGQDSLSFNKNNSVRIKNDSLALNLSENDTTYIFKNAYKLNQTEKNIILDSISKTKKSKELLKNYKTENEIFNDKNLIFLISLLNSKSIGDKVKRTLLQNKIDYDEKNKLKKSSEFGFRDFPSSSYQIDENKILRITKKYYSKTEAKNNFISSFYNRDLNFSQALFIINGNVKMSSLSSKKNRNLKIKKLKINRLKINRFILLDQLSGTAIFSENGKNGVFVIIETEK